MHYTDIINGTYAHDLYYETAGCHLMDFLGDVAFRYVFSSSQIYQMEMRESVILNFLLDQFVQAALYYDTDQPLGTIDKRYLSLISDNYKTAYRYHSRNVPGRKAVSAAFACHRLHLRHDRQLCLAVI